MSILTKCVSSDVLFDLARTRPLIWMTLCVPFAMNNDMIWYGICEHLLAEISKKNKTNEYRGFFCNRYRIYSVLFARQTRTPSCRLSGRITFTHQGVRAAVTIATCYIMKLSIWECHKGGGGGGQKNRS